MQDPSVPLPHAFFTVRGLENLSLTDALASLDPVIGSQVIKMHPTTDSPQIITACGRGSDSSLRILRHGLEIEELLTADLQKYVPNGMWTIKHKEHGKLSIIILF